ncbi:MAG: phage portal protein [Patescibacteria group bacterium]|nr:phage portal protein [Patescibacteria group bacterium]
MIKVDTPFRVFFRSLGARLERYFRSREVIKVLKNFHAQELAVIPGEQWGMVQQRQVKEIQAVKNGDYNIIDRRSWSYPFIPESLHRLNQPILKNTPYNLRRFCFSSDTEVLTSEGWKFWKQVTLSDNLPTYNMQTGGVEFQRPRKIFHYHLDAEEMHRYRSRDIDLLVTPEHYMLGRVRKNATQWKGNKTCPECEKPFLTTQAMGSHRRRIHSIKGQWDQTPVREKYGHYEYSKVSLQQSKKVRHLLESLPGIGAFEIPFTAEWSGRFPKSYDPETDTVEVKRYIENGRGKHFYGVEKVKVSLKDWVAFLGIYIAEGSFSGSYRGMNDLTSTSPQPLYIQALAAQGTVEESLEENHSRGCAVGIAQTFASGHYYEIKNLLQRLPWKFSEEKGSGFTVRDRGLYDLVVPLGNSYVRHVPRWVKNLPPLYLKIFLQWAIKGDGHERNKYGHHGATYWTVSKQLADDMQEIFQRSGSAARIRCVQPSDNLVWNIKSDRFAPQFAVSEKTRNFYGLHARHVKSVLYTGDVYCADIPNKTVYVRRNGKACWCGRSETPVPRSAINLVKGAILALPWKIEPTPEALEETGGEITPELKEQAKIVSKCLKFPNNADSWHSLMEAVTEDTIIGGYGAIEPRLTPNYERPFKLWAIDGCYAEDVEVLTKRGWIKWSEATKNDSYATRTLSGEFVWQKPTRMIRKKYCGNLIRFLNQEIDMLVTPNHEMLVKERVGGIWRKPGDKSFYLTEEKKVLAEDVAKSNENRRSKFEMYQYRVPATSIWKGEIPLAKKVIERSWKTGPKLGTLHHVKYEVDWNDWVAFLGIFIAEGSMSGSLTVLRRDKRLPKVPLYIQAMSAVAEKLPPGSGHQITISQSRNSPHYAEIKNLLLNKLPFPFVELKNGGFRCGDVTLWTELKKCGGNKYSKHVPEEIKSLPSPLINTFIDWAVKGDGSLNKKTKLRWYGTKSKVLADDMQELFQKVGSSACIYFAPPSKKKKWMFGGYYNTAPMYSVQERKDKLLGIGAHELISYDGDVYCAEVPNHTLYVRRNLRPLWCGNTTIRIYADWSESVPEKPHYAQLTGLKGERGIISFLDDEIMYFRTNVRSSTPFGLGCLEVAFNVVNAFLGVQDMAGRAASDNVHKTWLWWDKTIQAGFVETVRRHLRNESEGQGQIEIVAGLQKPEVLDVQGTNPNDLLLDWQQFLIRVIALAFNLSPMALGLERDVNRSTAEVMAESDFKRAVVPVAVVLAEHLNRDLIWGLVGWKDIQFKWVGLGDPSAMTQQQLYEIQYKNNFILPNEVRKEQGKPDLPGGWGQLSFAQTAILQAAVQGMVRGQQMSSQLAGRQQPQQTPPPNNENQEAIPLSELGEIDEQDLEQLAEQGYVIVPPQNQQPQQPQQPPLSDSSDSNKPAGILTQLTEQVEEFLKDAEKFGEKKKSKDEKLNTKSLEKQQIKKFKTHEHEISREEEEARDIEKRRQYALTNRPENQPAKEGKDPYKLPKRNKKKKTLGNQWTGRFPGGV